LRKADLLTKTSWRKVYIFLADEGFQIFYNSPFFSSTLLKLSEENKKVVGNLISLELHLDSSLSSESFYQTQIFSSKVGLVSIFTQGMQAMINLKNRFGFIDVAPSSKEEFEFRFKVFLGYLLNVCLLEKEGLLLHGFGALREDKGFLFLGPSGAGKSTLSSILQEEGSFRVFNDDRVALRKKNGDVLIYDTPFWNKDWRRNGKAKLKALFVLRKENFTQIKKISPAKVVKVVMEGMYTDAFSQILGNHLCFESRRKRNHQLMERLFNVLTDVAQRVPCYELLFSLRKDEVRRCLESFS